MSNMGTYGQPGASLTATVFGAVLITITAYFLLKKELHLFRRSNRYGHLERIEKSICEYFIWFNYRWRNL